MTAPPPRRPWWKRKRTWAAAALWLVVAYPLSTGPTCYAVRRGWITRHADDIYSAPVRAVLPPQEIPSRASPRKAAERAYWDWINWWDMEGFAAASDAEEAALEAEAAASD